MIGILIPAHNEEDLLDECLKAALIAASQPGLLAVKRCRCWWCSTAAPIARRRSSAATRCRVCTSRRAMSARPARAGARLSAGSGRALDFLHRRRQPRRPRLAGGATGAGRRRGVRHGDRRALERRLRCGRADPLSPGTTRPATAIGISTAPTWASVPGPIVRAGGFEPLACDEDVQLVRNLERCGATIAWSHRPQVHHQRAPGQPRPGRLWRLFARPGAAGLKKTGSD